MPSTLSLVTTDLNLLLPLGLAGVTLAAVGVARLTGRALRRMPRAIAVVTVVAGAAVVASGFVLRPTPPRRPVPASLTPSSPAPAQTTGNVTGSLRDARGEPIAAATVVLRRFERTEEREAAESTTAPDGSFSFSELPIAETTAYIASTDYEGTTFRSGLVLLDPHATSRSVELVVAPTTDDPASVTVAVDSTVVVGDRRGVQVVQILSVRNASDRAYTGGLRLPLMPRAQELQPRSGLDQTRLSLESGELVSTAPVMPRVSEIVYEYAVPMPARGLEVERSFRYPTGRFALLVGGDLEVRSRTLRPAGRVELDARTYRSYGVRDLRPGARADATVRPARGRDRLRAGAIAGAIAIAVGAIALPLVRRRRPALEAPPA